MTAELAGRVDADGQPHVEWSGPSADQITLLAAHAASLEAATGVPAHDVLTRAQSRVASLWRRTRDGALVAEAGE